VILAGIEKITDSFLGTFGLRTHRKGKRKEDSGGLEERRWENHETNA